MDINTKLINYLIVVDRAPLQQSYDCKAKMLSALAGLSTFKSPDYVKQLVEEFLKSFSIEEISAYVNKVDCEDANILFFCRDVDLMRIIIKYVRDIDARRVDSATALMVACTRGDIEIMELLLDNGADINAVDRRGITALMYYCMGQSPNENWANNNFESTVKLLIQRDADVLMKSNVDNRAIDFLRSIVSISENLLQLLQGKNCMGYTKNARKLYI